eukprot:scaffold2126_cov417-Prasinococcus_capsulatus_cf.AAC.10
MIVRGNMGRESTSKAASFVLQTVYCSQCKQQGRSDGVLRFRMLLYDDSQQDLVVDDFMHLGTLDDDLSEADAVFPSSSLHQLSYSEKCLAHYGSVAGKVPIASDGCCCPTHGPQQLLCAATDVLQVLVNPDVDSYWNVVTAVSDIDELNFAVVHEKSDSVLEEWLLDLRRPSRSDQ